MHTPISRIQSAVHCTNEKIDYGSAVYCFFALRLLIKTQIETLKYYDYKGKSYAALRAVQ